MINVSIDYGSCTEPLMQFHSEEIYMEFLPILEAVAENHNGEIVESVE